MKQEKAMYDFFAKHPVFSLQEAREFHADKGSRGKRAAESLLTYYIKTGRIINIKRGLYAVVPYGEDYKIFKPDPFLVAARMTKDAVLVYHTALEFHGRAYSVYTRFTYQTALVARTISFGAWQFQPVQIPGPLQRKGQHDFGIIRTVRGGMEVRVTSLERTFVDVLNRPVYAGTWEEIWRSLESIEFFDLDQVIKYVLILNNATTAARVGFFLEQNKERLMVDDKHLNPLRELRPKQPHYFDRGKSGNWVKSWNLIVPEKIMNRSWAEVV